MVRSTPVDEIVKESWDREKAFNRLIMQTLSDMHSDLVLHVWDKKILSLSQFIRFTRASRLLI
jgi:hypothetical protein